MERHNARCCIISIEYGGAKSSQDIVPRLNIARHPALLEGDARYGTMSRLLLAQGRNPARPVRRQLNVIHYSATLKIYGNNPVVSQFELKVFTAVAAPNGGPTVAR